MQLSCQLCKFETGSYHSLSAHVRWNHKISSKQYYDSYLSKPNDGFCKVCDSPTKFNMITTGYRDFCGPKCSRKISLANLKADPEKFKNFRNKVSAAVKLEWETKDQSERIANMTETLKDIRSKMTEEELKELYNPIKYMTSQHEIDAHFKRCVENGMGKWLREASEDEKTNMIMKRACSLRQTWDLYGPEIMKKQMATFLKNKETENFYYDEKNVDKCLSEFFGVGRFYG